MADEEVTIANVPEQNRYEIHVDGKLAGFATYDRTDGEVTYLHTEIDDAFGGRGLAKKLIQFALDDSRSRNEHVIARCPFVRDFIHKNHEYGDLTHRH